MNLGADKISTGRNDRIPQENEILHLKVGLDNNKDQSYFLQSNNDFKRGFHLCKLVIGGYNALY
jgi:tRNA U34 2-thiouridine synthase MnmA/TrmU